VAVKISLNGVLVENLPWAQLGEGRFFYGQRVMTTMLQIGDRIIDFQRHFARLNEDAQRIGIKEIFRPELLKQEILNLSNDAAKKLRYKVRVLLFEDSAGSCQKIITTEPLSSDLLKPEGVKLLTITDRNAPRGAQIKSGQLGSRSRELSKLNSSGYDEILWLNSDQEITEATWSNIFLIGRTGDLVEIATPPESSGILSGIVRSRIIDLLNASQIPVTVRVITAEEIPRFDEAFLTSSIKCLQPVAAIGRHKLHTLRLQSVFANILRLYNVWLSLENDFEHAPPGKPVTLM
jgi:branched-subunit amino acid aminotransferase/4-amino-4-deoxychorismate lyase